MKKLDHKLSMKRLPKSPTGIQGFDEITGGGVPEGRPILVCGGAGWATGTLNPEPYAWYSGWAVKRLIEDQINGVPNLVYKGTQPKAAWLSWGPYFWTDGTKSRKDGVTWSQADYQADGVHPSNTGRLKVANMLLQFFSTDPTTTPGF